MADDQQRPFEALPDAIEIALTVTRALTELGIPYLIGGSMASIVHGIPRLTQDIDLVADLREEHVKPLAAKFGADFYLDEQTIYRAIRARRSFNLIFLEKMFKVDVFIPQEDAWSKEEMQRRELKPLVEGLEDTACYVASAEAIILQKLRWFQKGGGVSERQWDDVLGVLKVQAGALDYTYLRQWAAELGVAELLRHAMVDAGLPSD
jgi:hypothetical protein